MKTSSGKSFRQAAFTLIEVLVVLLIIGISISALSGLNYSPESRSLYNQAKAFAGTAQLVQQEAVLGGHFWGIDFFTGDNGRYYGYRWMQFKDDIWQAALPGGMEEVETITTLSPDTELILKIEGLDVKPERMISLDDSRPAPEEFSPEVWFYPGHESTAFKVQFSHAEYGSQEITSDPLGRIQLSELEK